MRWEIEYTEEFEKWFDSLDEGDRTKVAASLLLLQQVGPVLGHPHTSAIKGSRHGAMRELRIQRSGRPLRALYIFDPRRVAMMLLGGDKTGDNRWYDVFVPIADILYDEHLEDLRKKQHG